MMRLKAPKVYAAAIALAAGAGVVGATEGLMHDCAEHIIEDDFGSGSPVKLVIPKGRQDGFLVCPGASANQDGRIFFQCQRDGLWKVHITCYDCPARDFKHVYLDSHRDVHVPAGAEGKEHTEECEFAGGKKYSIGEITYKCQGGKWQHTSTTCTDQPCPAGRAKVNFFGITGEVEYDLTSGSGQVSIGCPGDSPDPFGKISFQCVQKSAGKTGFWQFVSQTCQQCGPRSVDVEYEGHKKTIVLGGGALNGVEEHSCNFDDGHKYVSGKIEYQCFKNGWTLWETSCSEYLCPKSIMDVRMKYIENGHEVRAADTVEVPPKNKGRYELPCPKASEDSHARILVECRSDGTWALVSAECAGGALMRPM